MNQRLLSDVATHYRAVGNKPYCGISTGFLFGFPPKEYNLEAMKTSIKMEGYYRCPMCIEKKRLEIEEGGQPYVCR